jgi:lysyl-tRNA synthetase class 2
MSDSTPAINEYEQERRGKRDQLRAMGLDPYGHAEKNVKPLATVKAMYTAEMGHDGGPAVTVAGRIVLKRDMGKLSFLTLRDETGDLQVALDKKRLDEAAWTVNGLLDLGDQIVVDGPLGVTKKGEVTVWATALRVAAKSVLPPPGKWDGLADVELRYRQRYVDLWANPGVMKTLKLRSAVVAEVRAYLTGLGYTEVETPMMQPMAGGAAARPFTTTHNALGIPLFLRIAPELYLKRLLVGGFTKVFELNRNFRNEGVSPRHNPEFTMLEAYEAYGSWETMADLVEGMICHIAEKLFGGLKIEHKNAAGEVTKTINLARPWRRVTMAELVEQLTGWKFTKDRWQEAPVDVKVRTVRLIWSRSAPGNAPADDAAWDEPANKLKRFFTHDEAVGWEYHRNPVVQKLLKSEPAEQLVELYEKLIEGDLIDPTFVTQVPSVIIPLAKKNAADPFFADVYELAINGQEISPGYTELNDPDVQAANFAQQVGDEAEKQKTDDDFLTALKYGMPPAGGLGLGIDRLVMMLTGVESIRDVILFPLMRPVERS